MGLDWSAIQERYEARLDAEEAAGAHPIERDALRQKERAQRERAAQKQCERRARRVRVARKTKYDHAQMRELYTGGMSMKAVARELGCDQWTVSKALKRMGVPIVKHAGGRPRKTKTNANISPSEREVA